MKLHDMLTVYVDIDGSPVKAGQLVASFAGGRTLGGCGFAYDPGYFRTQGAYELDPRLVRGSNQIYSGGDQRLFGTFQDLTPDDWGRLVIDADLANARRNNSSIPRTIEEFDYLALAADETRLGAIRFRAGDAGEWLGPSHVTDLGKHGLDAYAEAAARLEAHEATPADLALLGAPGTSAGGARPKVNVYIDGKLRMLKLPSERDRKRDGEAWEHVAITLGRKAGINVQRGDLLRTTDGKSSLALHRFDRGPHGERIGYMSARTAMELGDHGHDRVTYQDFADVTDQVTGGDRAQLKDLFKRVALSVLISNNDDHWKNHGFLRSADRWTLSPAFDINPSMVSTINSRPISPRDDPRNRDIRNLVDTADTYGLTTAEAGRALAEIVAAVEEWPTEARAVGISSHEIEQMAVAFPEDQREHARQAASGLNSGPVIIDRPAVRASGSPGPQSRRGDHGLGKTPGGGNSGSFAAKRRAEPDSSILDSPPSS